jgi:hypothetical protein
MTQIILERCFTPSLSAEGFWEMALGSADCLSLYRVQWQESLLAADGSCLLCRFESPDTESVRMVARKAGTQIRAVWAGTVHDTGRTEQPDVVVERRFGQPVTLESVQAVEDAAASCLAAHRVTFLRTFFSLDRLRMICLYLAPDAESVRIAQRQAGMPAERVWACRRLSP